MDYLRPCFFSFNKVNWLSPFGISIHLKKIIIHCGSIMVQVVSEELVVFAVCPAAVRIVSICDQVFLS